MKTEFRRVVQGPDSMEYFVRCESNADEGSLVVYEVEDGHSRHADSAELDGRALAGVDGRPLPKQIADLPAESLSSEAAVYRSRLATLCGGLMATAFPDEFAAGVVAERNRVRYYVRHLARARS